MTPPNPLGAHHAATQPWEMHSPCCDAAGTTWPGGFHPWGDPAVPRVTHTACSLPATGAMLEGCKRRERTLQSRKTSPGLVWRRSLECILFFLSFFFFFLLFLFICNKCRRGGGDSEEVFAQNPAQSQDCVWLPDCRVLGPGRELPAAPQPPTHTGAGARGGCRQLPPTPQQAAPTQPGGEHHVPRFRGGW